MWFPGLFSFYDFFFLCGPFLKSLLNLLQYWFCFMFWFLGCKARGILPPWPEIQHTPPALEGKVLSTGLPGKSLPVLFLVFLPGGFPGSHLLLVQCFYKHQSRSWVSSGSLTMLPLRWILGGGCGGKSVWGMHNLCRRAWCSSYFLTKASHILLPLVNGRKLGKLINRKRIWCL